MRIRKILDDSGQPKQVKWDCENSGGVMNADIIFICSQNITTIKT